MTNLRSLNQDLNLKASIMSLANVDDELKYYTKYLNSRKEIDNFVERKKTVILSELREMESSLNQLKKEKERKETENLELSQKFNSMRIKENEEIEEIKFNKEEIMKKFLEICQKRKEISKLFDNRVNDYKKKDKEMDFLTKELNLYMNILKLRIINVDELQDGAYILKAYFINKNNTLKYFEIDLKEDDIGKTKKFAENFIRNFQEDDEIETLK